MSVARATVAAASTPVDDWDRPITSTSTTVRRPPAGPVPDDWDNDGDDDEDNQKLWDNANTTAPMPQFVISPSSTGPAQVSLPPAAFQAPIRILKRATASASTSASPSPSASSGSGEPRAQSAQQKSFAEREARYQAARERIFSENGKAEALQPSSRVKTKAKAGVGEAQTQEGVGSESGNGVGIIRSPRGPGTPPDGEGASGQVSSRGFKGRRRGKGAVSQSVSPPLTQESQ